MFEIACCDGPAQGRMHNTGFYEANDSPRAYEQRKLTMKAESNLAEELEMAAITGNIVLRRTV